MSEPREQGFVGGPLNRAKEKAMAKTKNPSALAMATALGCWGKAGEAGGPRNVVLATAFADELDQRYQKIAELQQAIDAFAAAKIAWAKHRKEYDRQWKYEPGGPDASDVLEAQDNLDRCRKALLAKANFPESGGGNA